MFSVLVLFGKPVDEGEFRDYFKQTHRPLISQLPNLKNSRANRVLGAVDGIASYYLTLELEFDSVEALQEGLNSDPGQAMAKDYQHFASGGVTVLICDQSMLT